MRQPLQNFLCCVVCVWFCFFLPPPLEMYTIRFGRAHVYHYFISFIILSIYLFTFGYLGCSLVAVCRLLMEVASSVAEHRL